MKKNETRETYEPGIFTQNENAGNGENIDNAGLEAPHAALETLDALAARHRLPAWQQAALVRMTGWLEGKSVTEVEFLEALAALIARPMGGGRH